MYSVRPRRGAPVSAPVTWREIEQGVTLDDFRIDNMRRRVQRMGDLFGPVLNKAGRADLGKIIA